jgi:hypothetical protein
MPLDDFLIGAVLFGAMLAAVAIATALIVRRRLRHLDHLELGLAAIVVGTAVLIGVHLLPLMLGILTRGTVLAAAALAVALAALVHPAAAGDPDPPHPPAPPSSRASWMLPATAAAFATAAALADLGRWAGDELVGVDPLTFHLPNVARWIQTGTVWQIDQFVPLLAQGNYPHNGDVVLLSTVLPWHNDFLVRLPITFYLVALAVAVFAVARELGAARAASVLAAAVVVSMPVVGLATIPRALPDSLMWATYTTGVLFLLRNARTRRRSDLVVAGVALAIACGTKWYGVSSVPVLIAIWLVARLLHARRAGEPPGALRRALSDGVLVGGLAFLGMAVWLVRNLALSGNPVFPLQVKPFGITIFDAPPDIIRDQAGWSIADYAGDLDVLRQLAGEVIEGIGSAPVVCAIGLVVAVVLARRGGRAPDSRIIALAAGAVVLGLLYTVTPATALGLRGDPSLANSNTRYAVPALLLAVPALAWAAGRLPRVPALLLEAALAVGALFGAWYGYEVQLRDLAVAVVVMGAMALSAWVLWRSRERRVVLAGAAVASLLLGLAAANRMQDRINDGRYRNIDPGVDAMLQAAPSGTRVALAADWTVAGLSPIWPAFGTRIDNHVEFMGRFVDGFLTPWGDERSFQAALRRGRFDVLVVGRGFYPPEATPEQDWAIAAGWRTIALTARLRVLIPPAAAG